MAKSAMIVGPWRLERWGSGIQKGVERQHIEAFPGRSQRIIPSTACNGLPLLLRRVGTTTIELGIIHYYFQGSVYLKRRRKSSKANPISQARQGTAASRAVAQRVYIGLIDAGLVSPESQMDAVWAGSYYRGRLDLEKGLFGFVTMHVTLDLNV